MVLALRVCAGCPPSCYAKRLWTLDLIHVDVVCDVLLVLFVVQMSVANLVKQTLTVFLSHTHVVSFFPCLFYVNGM